MSSPAPAADLADSSSSSSSSSSTGTAGGSSTGMDAPVDGTCAETAGVTALHPTDALISQHTETHELTASTTLLLSFTLNDTAALPRWMYALVSCDTDCESDTLVSLLQSPLITTATNATERCEAVTAMSQYATTLLTSTTTTSLPANLRLLSTQHNGGNDTILIAPLTSTGHYGLLVTNTDTTTNKQHKYTLALSPAYTARPVVSEYFHNPLTLDFPVSSIGLFLLFLLLSALTIACLVLGRRYCASFRRKGGKKYHGVSKLPEEGGGGGGSGGGGGGGSGLDGARGAEGGDGMDSWDAEMKEMDTLELHLSDDDEQQEFELHEIAITSRPTLQPQPPPQQHHSAFDSGGGKRSPAREETKTNGSPAGGDRLSVAPIRPGSAALESVRRSPSPVAQPVMPTTDTQQQRVLSSGSGKKKKPKKRRDEEDGSSEA